MASLCRKRRDCICRFFVSCTVIGAREILCLRKGNQQESIAHSSDIFFFKKSLLTMRFDKDELKSITIKH